MATRIHPLRFDRRRSREARHLLASLSVDERRVLALVMRHTVSGRWVASRGATAIAVVASGTRGGRPRVLEQGDISLTITSLVVNGWLRFVPTLEGRGNFWRTDAAEAITRAACVSAPDLDPTVPA